MIIKIDPEEQEARESTICAGCNEEKQKGLIVCWNCFKHRTDITPLKYWNGTYGGWLEMEILDLK